MHEFSIAQSLIQAAEQAAPEARRITKLRCRIGVLRQVDDGLLAEAWRAVREGTACSLAELVVEKCSMMARCAPCGQDFAVRDWDWTCPSCKEEGQLVGGGDELELTSIDAEMPDED